MPGLLRGGDRVLFLCTGNICRSPFAEFHLRLTAAARGLAIAVRSAGTHAVPGNRVPDEALAAAAEHGVDLAPHRAMPLTLPVIGWSTHILAMSAAHARLVEPMCVAFAPDKRPRVVVWEIEDPYGFEVGVYRACYRAIAQRVGELL